MEEIAGSSNIVRATSGGSMDKPADQLQQQVSQYLDQQNADVAIFKVTLQVLIWNIVRRDPQGLGIVKTLKDEVLASLARTMAPPPGVTVAQDVERLRQLTLVRAGKLFQDIEQALGAPAGDPRGG